MGSLSKIGDVRLFAEIHRGALAIVYKGFQESLDRTVIVKVLKPELMPDGAARDSFEKEAKLIARLQHPNVVSIHDFGWSEQGCYFVTEYVEGLTLRKLIDEGPIPQELATFILKQITDGLENAHREQILHRDIKPDNILVSNSGQVKIADFGLSVYAGQGSRGKKADALSGTVNYFPPEVILGRPVTAASDIFSLGATFFEMLMGAKAFTGRAPSDCFQAILKHQPELELGVKVETSVAAICAKMLEKEPDERYSGCIQLSQDLSRIESSYDRKICSRDLVTYMQSPERFPKVGRVSSNREPPRERRGFAMRPRTLALVIAGILAGLAFAVVLQRGWEPAKLSPVEPVVDLSAHDSSGIVPMKEVHQPVGSMTEMAPTVNEKATSSEPAFLANGHAGADQIAARETMATPSNTLSGYLEVSCRPWGAVFLNGDSIGLTPLPGPLLLAAGRYSLTFKNSQFPDYTIETEVGNNSTRRVDFSFWETVAQLKLDVSPWAEVYVDSVYQDVVPPQARPIILSEGRHELWLRHPSLGEWRTEIRAEAGTVLDMKFNLAHLLKPQ